MLIPYITQKQREIILLLYRFRFLNRIQIQKLFHNKDYKNTNQRLKDLVDKKYLGRIYERTFQGNTIPSVYYLTLNGLRFLTTQPQCERKIINKLKQEKRKLTTFINACMLIGDVYINLSEKFKDSSSTLKFYTQNDFPLKAKIQDLLPTFAYVIKNNNKIENFACEIIKDTLPPHALHGRIKHYVEYFSDKDHSTPRPLILIYSSNKQYKHIRRTIKRINEEEGLENFKIYITNWENMKIGNIGESFELEY